jgi:hypothetical protein
LVGFNNILPMEPKRLVWFIELADLTSKRTRIFDDTTVFTMYIGTILAGLLHSSSAIAAQPIDSSQP